MIGIALCSWLSWVVGTAVGAVFGNGPLKAYPAIEASLTFMLPALFLSFLLASFKRQQSFTVVASIAASLAALLIFSIPASILAGIAAGCIASLFSPKPQSLPEVCDDK